MKLLIAFTELDVDVIEVPDFVIGDLKKIRNKFDRWLYDKNNKLSWDSENKVFCFRTELFVYWLNKFVLSDCEEKAIQIESQVETYDKSLPILWF